MKLLAHLVEVNGIKTEQSLKDHCLKTAEYAAKSVQAAGIYHTAYVAGILHDLGKGKEEFIKYLEDAYQGKKVIKGSVNHTFAGCIWLLEKYHTEHSTPWEKLTCEIIAYAIGAHHGLFDCVDLNEKNGFLHRLEKDREEIGYAEAVSNYISEVTSIDQIDEYFQKSVQEIEKIFQTAKETYGAKDHKSIFFQVSMLIRLVLSSVIYGDRRDTSEFMNQKNIAPSKIDWEERQYYFHKKISQFSHDTLLNQVRADISAQCLEAAKRESGIYRLNVPTGAGKTLSILRYALEHAKRYQKKRIIFIIPLLSVLDQNAKVIRDYLPYDEEILEHHSNVIQEKVQSEEADPYEFLAESWNYPIVISTLVQLLQISFSEKTSAVGRMQALCDSVIVIDEVQSLPKKITVMFNLALNFLSQYARASIILSSATQPCFEELRWPLHLAKQPDLVRLTQEQLQVFQRSEILDRTKTYGMDEKECAAFCMEQMERYPTLLLICNTKTEARHLFEHLRSQTDPKKEIVYHLSTSMCQKHRLDVLEELTKHLAAWYKEGRGEKKVICVSTQLIEAGVDISFSCVVRILAGIDNLAQAAGRCNRSQEYGQNSVVYLINLRKENLSMLREIQQAQASTNKVLELWKDKEESLIGEEATRYFYRSLYAETKDVIRYPLKYDHMTLYLTDLLSNANAGAKNEKHKDYFLHQPFQTIGHLFQVFDENTTDILVPHEKGAQIIEQLKELPGIMGHFETYRTLLEQAKPYMISIYQWQKEKLAEAGLLDRLLDGRAVCLDQRAYDEVMGLLITEELPVENYIL